MVGCVVPVPRTLPFILASESPQKPLALLGQIAVVPHGVDSVKLGCLPEHNELPTTYVARLAREKAMVVAKLHPNFHILAVNTAVACGRRILPVTKTVTEAKHCLNLLSGRRHRVLGSVYLYPPKGKGKPILRVITTVVAFKRLEDVEYTTYLECREWYGKAGGYFIQGRAAAFVRFIAGSYDNVVGLSLYETTAILKGAGLLFGTGAPCITNNSLQNSL